MTYTEHQASANECYRTLTNDIEDVLSPVLYSPETGLSVPEVGAHEAWDALVEGYLNAALDSLNTRRAYKRHLANAGAILGDQPLASLSGSELAAYRSLVIGADLAPSSKAQALTALRSFLIWAGDMGGHRLSARLLRVALKAPTVSTAARYHTVSDPEARAMFAAAETARERALLGVLLGAGLRVAEVAHLKVADVTDDMDGASALFVHQGKGRKDRVVPIREDVVLLIRAYLADTHRYLNTDGPLFLAKDRGAQGRTTTGLSTRAISRTIRKLALDAGISAKKVTPHALRHSFAMRCLRSGMNVVAVSKLLGHSNIATTQRYLDHLALDELRGAIPSLPLE